MILGRPLDENDDRIKDLLGQSKLCDQIPKDDPRQSPGDEAVKNELGGDQPVEKQAVAFLDQVRQKVRWCRQDEDRHLQDANEHLPYQQEPGEPQ